LHSPSPSICRRIPSIDRGSELKEIANQSWSVPRHLEYAIFPFRSDCDSFEERPS
jgi:hypothetical protein